MVYWWCLFFKQKTAYEMRIGDWSSDVCASDLPQRDRGGQEDGDRGARPSDHRPWVARQPEVDGADLGVGAGAVLSARPVPATAPLAATPSLCDEAPPQQIGRASCRARVCQDV